MSDELESAVKRAEKAERQRDCPHLQTEWGICTSCEFDYRTYDADDSKCGKCGSWREHKLVCQRCEPPHVCPSIDVKKAAERIRDDMKWRALSNPRTQAERIAQLIQEAIETKENES